MAASAYEYALNLLTARSYSIRNLRRKLVQKEYPSEQVNAVIERLIANGLLNDDRYAEQFVRGRLLGPGASRLRLKQQLYQRGIKGDVAESAIARVMADEPVDVEAMVLRAARKKIASMGDLEPLVVRRRLYAHLARAGYNPDEIRSAMKKALEPE
ncbi:MAG TPA: regulatory protein RecX [Gemmatimonadaceae bacterium]|nr:regulatory protein RecX [Gemmatimonadaceae bacterium]